MSIMQKFNRCMREFLYADIVFQAFLSVSKDIGMKWSQQTDYSRSIQSVILKKTGILLNHKLYLHSLLICHDLWFYINALGAQIKLQIFCWWSRWKVLFKNFLVWDWEVNTDVDSRKLSLWLSLSYHCRRLSLTVKNMIDTT